MILTDRVIDIQGAGVSASDVVIDSSGYSSSVIVEGDDSEIHLSHLAFRSDSERAGYGGGGGSATLTDIDACTWPIQRLSMSHSVGYERTGTFSLTRSRMCGTRVDAGGSGGDNRTEVLIAENLLMGDVYLWVGTEGDSTVRNNILVGPTLLGVTLEDEHTGTTALLTQNTVLTSQLTLAVSLYGNPLRWEDTVEVTNNLFVGSTSAGWDVELTHYGDENRHCDPLIPTGLSRNLVWRQGTVAGRCVGVSEDYYFSETSDISDLIPELMDGDPLLTTREGQGPYALGEGSAAIDVGSGDDVDGTDADLGAFGGEYGEWWREVGWLSP